MFEALDRCGSILADFDDVAVGIAHVAMPFPAVVVERLGLARRVRSGKMVSTIA